MTTHATRVASVRSWPVDIALREPFGISGGALSVARNLLVEVVLASGTSGYGEAAPFPAFNGETREQTEAALAAVAGTLVGRSASDWRELAVELDASVHAAASARAALEMALVDALARERGVSLAALFGGAGTELVTDITITTGTAAAAREAAGRIAREGYATIKLKVGGAPLGDDVDRVRAVVEAAPGCGLLLDANGGMGTADAALTLLAEIERVGGRVVLFEQPLGGDDLAGMAVVASRARCPVAADESVASADDVARVAAARAASVVNVKLMKSGVAGALDIVAAARAHGLGLMIGGMVESSLAMSVSACLAAGVGGFSFVDLDTPLWMVDEPIVSTMARVGPRLSVASVTAGHGARPRSAVTDRSA